MTNPPIWSHSSHSWSGSRIIWWFQNFDFPSYLGKISNLTNIFQMGWNHQPVIKWLMQDVGKHTIPWILQDLGGSGSLPPPTSPQGPYFVRTWGSDERVPRTLGKIQSGGSVTHRGLPWCVLAKFAFHNQPQGFPLYKVLGLSSQIGFKKPIF